MREVVQVVCPHGPVQTFIHHEGHWSTVITEQQTARESETGEFIEYRYPVRCEECGTPDRPLVGDVTQQVLDEAMHFIINQERIPQRVTLALWVRIMGQMDKVRHAGTRPTANG